MLLFFTITSSQCISNDPSPVTEKMIACTELNKFVCCNATGLEFLEKYIFPGYGAVFGECISCSETWKKIMCAVTCSPKQRRFISDDNSKLFLCSDLCFSLYYACSDEMLPLPIKTRVRYKYQNHVDFCKSGVIRLEAEFGLLEVEVVDKSINYTQSCLDSKELSDNHNVHIKPYCFARDTTAFLATSLSLCMIPFMVGVIFTNSIHKHQFHFIPEPLVMILMGMIFAITVSKSSFSFFFDIVFDRNLLVIFLLPPIIIETGYTLRQKKFMKNVNAIVIYGIICTMISTIVLALTIYYSQDLFNFKVKYLLFGECLTFASLLCAADPIATITSFYNMHVEEDLSIIILGESLTSDVVAIVLFNTFKTFFEEPNGINVIDSIFMFLMILFASPLLGFLFGILSSLVFKHVQFEYDSFFWETIIFFMFTYFSFIVAEALSLSGIISSLVCGLFVEHYAYLNLTTGGKEMTLLFYKQLSTMANMLIFYMIGMMVVVTWEDMHLFFTMLCFLIIIAARFISMCPLTCLMNRYSKKKIPWNYMCMVWFSGIRGVIALALAMHIPSAFREEAIATVISLIIVTSFIFGSTTPSMLKLLKIKTGVEKQMKNIVVGSPEEEENLSTWGFLDKRYFKRYLIRPTKLESNELEDGPQDQLNNMYVTLLENEVATRKTRFSDDLGKDGWSTVLRGQVGSFFSHNRFTQDDDIDNASQYQLMDSNDKL